MSGSTIGKRMGWGGRMRRFLPLVVLGAGLALGYACGLQDYLSLSTLADKRDELRGFVDAHFWRAVAAYFAVYVVAVAFSFPAASALTIFGGFLFGWLVAGSVTAIAATLGATAIFLAARTAFGDVLRRRAGPALARLAAGFQEDGFSYLLVLRLAPVFPFFLVNIAPAFFGIATRTYVAATFLGILPATFAYSWLGEGVDSVFASAAEARREASIADLVTPEITAAFGFLALVAAIPPVVRRLRRGKAG